MIGVEDDTTVVGVEARLGATTRRPIAEALAGYSDRIMRDVGERVNPRPVCRMREHTVEGRTVLAVHVEQAQQRPVTMGREIYVRCAGSTCKADGPAIQEMIAATASEMARRDQSRAF